MHILWISKCTWLLAFRLCAHGHRSLGAKIDSPTLKRDKDPIGYRTRKYAKRTATLYRSERGDAGGEETYSFGTGYSTR